jgi:23S rRNA pseudouridine1911/1915/1917 synthase
MMERLTEKEVIYEDNHLIIVNKPAGLPVQDDESGDASLVELTKLFIKEKYKKPGAVYLGLIHRIDRPVSGLVLMAKTSKAASRLSEMFRERKIKKTYLAVVENQPPKLEGTLRHYIWKDKDANRAMCYDKERTGSKLAVLQYKLLEEVNQYILLEVTPETGRPHQIRAQLTAMGCPIVGDIKYGSKTTLRDRSICLFARRLEFIHPVKNTPLEVLAPVPYNRYWQRFELHGR